jgi:hypothetical protein
MNDVASFSNAGLIGQASDAGVVGLILIVLIVMIIRKRRDRLNDTEEVEEEPVFMKGTLDDEFQSATSEGREE